MGSTALSREVTRFYYTTGGAEQYALQQDVDQRITRDVARLCDDLAALIPSAVKPVVDLLWFRCTLDCHPLAPCPRAPTFLQSLPPETPACYLCLDAGWRGADACMASTACCRVLSCYAR